MRMSNLEDRTIIYVIVQKDCENVCVRSSEYRKLLLLFPFSFILISLLSQYEEK